MCSKSLNPYASLHRVIEMNSTLLVKIHNQNLVLKKIKGNKKTLFLQLQDIDKVHDVKGEP